MQSWKNISLWMDQLDDPITARPALQHDIQADVAIMGAGYTGLWTAYYLKKQQPELNIVIVEAQTAGFGASGRNGGWLMGELSGQDSALSNSTAELKQQAHDLIHGIPDEVQKVLLSEGIHCDYKKGGMLIMAARYPEQKPRLKQAYTGLMTQGYHPEDQHWLDSDQLRQHIRIDSAEGAIFTPHCASIHPAKLVRGLAEAVEKLGVTIYENSAVTHWGKGYFKTAQATVSANWIVPALEAYGASLDKSMAPLTKYHLPVQSLIIATEPIGEDIWHDIGLSEGQVFSDYSRQVTYAVRTADNRLVFGARGGYRFAGKLRENFDLSNDEIALRRDIMVELFPQLKETKITHSWGGNLAMSRRFHPHMILDKENQFALAGGYGGEGVGATNLAGRTLADLILGNSSQLTKMPWVTSGGSVKDLKQWEPEPFTWLGYRAITDSFDREDKTLRNLNSANWKRKVVSKIADVMEKFLG